MSSSWHSSSGISTGGSTRCWFFYILSYQSMSVLLYLGESATFGNLLVECFQPSVDTSGELCISSCISSPSSVQIFGTTCHRSIQTPIIVVAPLLDGGSLDSHSSQYIWRYSSLMSYHKWSHQGVLINVKEFMINVPLVQCVINNSCSIN